MITLPFKGPPVTPPAIAFAMINGIDNVHNFARERKQKDAHGWDCNDYAVQAVEDLIADGRDPYFVQCFDELGEQHLIAAYATSDGVLYARDNRAPRGDLSLDQLVAHGYRLIAAADRKGLLWHANADAASAPPPPAVA
jgi:hypothetical protein